MITPLRADSFRTTYPLSFQLNDGEGKAALYIVSEAKIDQQQLILEISNTSGSPIYFASLQSEGAPTANACHFELRFRLGTLSKTTLGVGTAETPASTAQLATTRAARKTPPAGGAWQISDPAQIREQGSGWVSYYIGRMGKGAPWMMAPDATIRLTLQGISAAAEAGTRETRAALLPGNEKLYFAEPSAESKSYLTQAREQTLRVINHLGEPNIPLHTGFIGPYTILNDGTPHDHQLELRLTNTSAKKPIRFNKQSKIHLNFDTAPTPDQAGAIGTRENAEAIRFFLGVKRSEFGAMDEAAREAQEIQKDPSSEMGETSFKTISYYDLTRVYDQEVLIPPKESLVLLIDFSLFETIHPAGLTFLHLHYENIPGYWDGQLSVPIEISPLWISVDPANNRVVLTDSGERILTLKSHNSEIVRATSGSNDMSLLKIENTSAKGGTWGIGTSGGSIVEGAQNGKTENYFAIQKEGNAGGLFINDAGYVSIGNFYKSDTQSIGNQLKLNRYQLEIKGSSHAAKLFSDWSQGTTLTIQNNNEGKKEWDITVPGPRNSWKHTHGSLVISRYHPDDNSMKAHTEFLENGDLAPKGDVVFAENSQIRVASHSLIKVWTSKEYTYTLETIKHISPSVKIRVSEIEFPLNKWSIIGIYVEEKGPLGEVFFSPRFVNEGQDDYSIQVNLMLPAELEEGKKDTKVKFILHATFIRKEAFQQFVFNSNA